MATAVNEQNFTAGQKELVAVGASVGAGCHPCVSHHLKAGADAGLEAEQLLAAVTRAERVTAEAAVLMADHASGKIGPAVTTPAGLPPLEDALAALGAALGANDASAIDLQMGAARDLGASRAQLKQAIETAKTVQENASRIHVRGAQRLLDSITPSESAAETEPTSSRGRGCSPDDEAAAGAASSGETEFRPPMAEYLGADANG